MAHLFLYVHRPFLSTRSRSRSVGDNLYPAHPVGKSSICTMHSPIGCHNSTTSFHKEPWLLLASDVAWCRMLNGHWYHFREHLAQATSQQLSVSVRIPRWLCGFHHALHGVLIECVLAHLLRFRYAVVFPRLNLHRDFFCRRGELACIKI